MTRRQVEKLQQAYCWDADSSAVRSLASEMEDSSSRAVASDLLSGLSYVAHWPIRITSITSAIRAIPLQVQFNVSIQEVAQIE